MLSKIQLKVRSQNQDLHLICQSAEFDARWYRNHHEDLRDTKIDVAKHYLLHGAKERRNPGPNFDTSSYLSSYQDVASSGMNPLVHYLRHGRKEGRSPVGEPFDSEFYIRLHPDAIQLGLSAVQHYIMWGKSRFSYTYFDEAWYREEYQQFLGDCTSSLLEHFFARGRYEGMHPSFNSNWYRHEYPDVALSGQVPLDHYRNHGRLEGRLPAFDPYFYLQEYPDVASGSIDPFEHYNSHGRNEGRSPAFNAHWYLKTYIAASATTLGPFEHYSKIGRPQGLPLNRGDIWAAVNWGYVSTGADLTKPWHISGAPSIADPSFAPMVTIIVPNYNHEKYLKERLDSVYSQTYANFEVILLDDASTDGSRDLLNSYAEQFPDTTTCVFNSENSGGVFRQWKKGLELAKGELIWIAESDDLCDIDFLDKLVRLFQTSGVTLAFSRTDFVSGTTRERIWTSEEYWREVGFDLGSASTVVSAHQLVNRAWGARNLIANVSSALFRNPGKLDLLDDPVWQGLRICGDWIFYLSLMRGGLVAYSPDTTNYYRIHPQNTSTSTHDRDIYFQEHEIVASYLVRLFKVDDTVLRFHEEVLYRHWVMKRGNDRRADFSNLFNVEKLIADRSNKKPNIAIATFALVTGGGETFPILIANELFRRGFPVTVINYAVEKTNPGIRSLVDHRIPIVEPQNSKDTGLLLEHLGIDLIHTHHSWVDVVVASALNNNFTIKHVVTTHGLYELLDTETRDKYSETLMRVDAFVYIADKNLNGFPKKIKQGKSFTKITNTIFLGNLSVLNRVDFGIDEDEFIVCLASRAVPEKGWSEAIAAIVEANRTSLKRIHLILVGDGPEHERLCKETLPNFVHLVGFQKNVRDYFAMSDLGLLPSRFRGESCPLVLIECLSVGRPVVASDVGEVSNMLATPSGLAGVALPLHDWEVDISALAKTLLYLSNDPQAYNELKERSTEAFSKFDHEMIINQYVKLFDDVLRGRLTQPRLSVVIVAYNMQRELPRTIRTMSANVQGISADEYEIIIVDNGSTCEYDLAQLRSICPNITYYKMEDALPSPVRAFNYGVSKASGKIICACIDGARMASPNLLKAGLEACEMDERVVAGALSFHLGLRPQNESVKDGYNQTTEDHLLSSVNWEADGYALFGLSSFDPSSRFGLYKMPAETNALFMSSEKWSGIGGLDPAFECRGGGLANLDIWRRLCEDPYNIIVLLLGEGTFHQVHGGAATNAIGDVWTGFHKEYKQIRGREYAVPDRQPLLKGRAHQAMLDFQQRADNENVISNS